jgi:hypothetical protein
LHAFLLGGEIACRIGNAVSPGHYARGWHITASCGIFGAAAAAARLMRLSAEQTADALGTYAQKGRLIAITGKIQLENYVNKDNVKQQTVKVLIDGWNLLDSRKEQDTQSPPPNPRPAGKLQVDDIDDPFAD